MPTKIKPRKIPNITIENAKILFRNLSGSEARFNPAGNRNFCVLLPNDEAISLKEDGWNVKYLQPKEEGDTEQAYLKVKVNYNNTPPRIVLISDHKKTDLNELTVHILDWVDIFMVDLTMSPYHWEMNGKTGISAYVKFMYVTLAENELEKKYRDVPDSAMSALQEND